MRMINNDNIYPENSFVSTKAAPGTLLRVVKYLHRIYYCEAMNAPDQKQLAYFERELMPSNAN